MLNEYQITCVWESMIEAETRALYFADLKSRYVRQKQIVTGLSFFLSSGAAATVIAKSPPWVPVVLALLSAGLNAYSMAVGLDRRVGTMAKLHSAWSRIAAEYDRLWNHAHDEGAETELDKIIHLEKEPSELAVTEAPNDQKLMGKWQDHVFRMARLAAKD